MSDPYLALADQPLGAQAISVRCTAGCNRKILALLSLLTGLSFVVLLRLVPSHLDRDGTHLGFQEPVINLAAGLQFSQGLRLPGPHVAPGRQYLPLKAFPGGSQSARAQPYEPGPLRRHYPFVESRRAFQSPKALPPSLTSLASDTAAPAPPRFESGVLSEFVFTNAGVKMPRLIYGTTLKQEYAENFLQYAVKAGLKGIDIPVNPGIVGESGIGPAMKSLISSGVPRDSFFIQAKIEPFFESSTSEEDLAALLTSPGEPVKPSIAKNVEVLIAGVLSNLGVEYVDSLVLQGPFPGHGDTMQAWRAMESAVEKGMVRQLGISNPLSLKRVRRLYEDATLKPAVVQQRSDKVTAFEREISKWCLDEGVYKQSFWVSTFKDSSSVGWLIDQTMQDLATKYSVTPTVLFLRFLMGRSIVPLTGTSNIDSLEQDLSAWNVDLTAEDAEKIDEVLRKSAKT